MMAYHTGTWKSNLQAISKTFSPHKQGLYVRQQSTRSESEQTNPAPGPAMPGKGAGLPAPVPPSALWQEQAAVPLVLQD